MAEILLFHHAQGLTKGCLAFADALRAEGHVVHTPDLFDGNTFDTIDEGLAYEEQSGLDIRSRGAAAADELPNELVYAGFSLGVIPAQMLAQTRPGARGALLMSSCIPPSEFGDTWPERVPAQIHLMDADPFALEGDLDAARALAGSTEGVELFLYPGDKHLFADESLADYDEAAATKLRERVLEFLSGVG
ncbi:MAG TPA: dienelactone hydrolase family protein [Actinomycetota bacterium]